MDANGKICTISMPSFPGEAVEFKAKARQRFDLHSAKLVLLAIAACCDRMDTLLATAGRIKMIQFHTIARDPTEPYVAHLSSEELDRIAAIARRRLSILIEVFNFE